MVRNLNFILQAVVTLRRATLSREIGMIKSLGKLFYCHTPTTPS